MPYYIKYVHRISPRDRDIEGPFASGHQINMVSAETASKWIGRMTNSPPPRVEDSRQTEDGLGWIFFPSYRTLDWHSISVVWDPNQ